MLWMQREHIPQPWGPTDNPNAMRPERAFRHPHHSWRLPEGWTGQHLHLGRNKEGFGAELTSFFALWEPSRENGRRK